MQEAISERLKEAQELERKLARLAKTMDHMERARREEEAPLLDALYKWVWGWFFGLAWALGSLVQG